MLGIRFLYKQPATSHIHRIYQSVYREWKKLTKYKIQDSKIKDLPTTTTGVQLNEE